MGGSWPRDGMRRCAAVFLLACGLCGVAGVPYTQKEFGEGQLEASDSEVSPNTLVTFHKVVGAACGEATATAKQAAVVLHENYKGSGEAAYVKDFRAEVSGVQPGTCKSAGFTVPQGVMKLDLRFIGRITASLYGQSKAAMKHPWAQTPSNWRDPQLNGENKPEYNDQGHSSGGADGDKGTALRKPPCKDDPLAAEKAESSAGMKVYGDKEQGSGAEAPPCGSPGSNCGKRDDPKSAGDGDEPEASRDGDDPKPAGDGDEPS